MIRLYTLAVSCLLVVELAFGQEATKTNPLKRDMSVTRYATICVVQVEQVQTSLWDAGNPQRRALTVRGRLIRVLKDDNKQNLTPSTFNVQLPQARWPVGFIGDNPYFWSYREIQAGDNYLIFSNAKGLSAMFASPGMAELIIGQSDEVSDVELVIASSSGSLQGQAQAVATALGDSGRPHSVFLSEYAAAILAGGNERETLTLARALEGQNVRLTEDAEASLLWNLFEQARSNAGAPDHLIRVFGTIVARSLLAMSTQGALTPLQVNILQNYLPWIASSDRASRAFRALAPEILQQLRNTASQLVSDTRLSTEQRAQIRELLIVIR